MYGHTCKFLYQLAFISLVLTCCGHWEFLGVGGPSDSGSLHF